VAYVILFVAAQQLLKSVPAGVLTYQSGRTFSLVTSPGRIDATEARPTSSTSSTPSTEQHLSPVKMSGATVDHTQSICNERDADSELS
jgi:hypothetical protein